MAAIFGVTRDFRERSEPHGERTQSVWTFRIERYGPDGRPLEDESGNPLRPVQVEMKGLSFSGTLSDGDRVRVEGEAEDGVIQTSQVYNEETGSWVRARGTPLMQKVAVAIFLVIFLVVALVMATTLMDVL